MADKILFSEKPTIAIISCIHCLEEMQIQLESIETAKLTIDCFNCHKLTFKKVRDLPNYIKREKKFQEPKPQSKSKSNGSNKAPKSMEYYDVLNVGADATSGEIKKSYYLLAMQFHPDKNKDEGAEEKFKKISEAYQILSDPKLRSKYDEFGVANEMAPDGGFVDPEEFFKQLFGGDKFTDFIGEINLAQDLKKMMNQEEDDSTAIEDTNRKLTLEEKLEKKKLQKKERDEKNAAFEDRINELSKKLLARISSFVDQYLTNINTKVLQSIEKEFYQKTHTEAEELKHESYGIELLHTIGTIYSLKATRTLEHYQSNPIFNFAKGAGYKFTDTYSYFSDAVSTIKSTVQLHKTATALNEEPKEGVAALTSEERAKLEQEFAVKGLSVIWQGSRFELQSVLRSVCDQVLDMKKLDKNVIIARAKALKIIGDIFKEIKA